MRDIKIYKGNEITEEVISKIKHIAKQKYPEEIYVATYGCVDTIKHLAILHEVNESEEVIVLGDDWFLGYACPVYTFYILDWVALDNKETKLAQSIEMMSILKLLLYKYSEMSFSTSMRHSTSYKLYSKLLDKEYVEEVDHDYDIDYCSGYAPWVVRNLDHHESDEIYDFIYGDVAKKNPEYLLYILHSITFTVTSKYTDDLKIKEKDKKILSLL